MEIITAVQIVAFNRAPDPALVVATDGELQTYPLTPGRELSFSLGTRHCAGSIEASGHIRCNAQRAPHCAEHVDDWICARCRGICLKDEMDCHEDHVVYLAIVAPDQVKVGVTKAARIEQRLTEQGADRGAVIREVTNGRIAREIENHLATDLPDRISISAKIRGLTDTIDEAVWDAALGAHEVIQLIEPTYDLHLTSPPIPETLATGIVRGVKGRLLVLECQESAYVCDLRNLVGYTVVPGGAAPDRQTGLGAFS